MNSRKKKKPACRKGPSAAFFKTFSYAGAGAAFISGIYTAARCPSGWYGIPDALIFLFGGWGILKGKRLVAVALTAYITASRWPAGITGIAVTGFIFLPAYALGIAGAFARNRAARIEAGAQDTRLVDADIAVSFIRLAGAAGFSFGIFVAIFSLAQIEEFTRLNLIDAFLMILFSWYTLKRQAWAVASQLIVSFSNIAAAYSLPGNLYGVFGSFPLFLFGLYSMGFLGAVVLSGERRQKDKET